MNGRFDTALKCFKSFVSSPGFFESGIMTACLNCLGIVPVERETIIAVTDSTRSFRHCFMIEVGIGSNMQLLLGDRTFSSQISFSMTGSKRESKGPSYPEKVGNSHERVTKLLRRLLILLERKSQKCCGSSERGTSDGRGGLRDFPNSSLDTEKSCRLEHMGQFCHNRTDTQPHSSSLFNKDLSVLCDAGLSPLLLSSRRPDLLRHPRSRGAVSNTPGNRRSMAVENLS